MPFVDTAELRMCLCVILSRDTEVAVNDHLVRCFAIHHGRAQGDDRRDDWLETPIREGIFIRPRQYWLWILQRRERSIGISDRRAIARKIDRPQSQPILFSKA